MRGSLALLSPTRLTQPVRWCVCVRCHSAEKGPDEFGRPGLCAMRAKWNRTSLAWNECCKTSSSNPRHRMKFRKHSQMVHGRERGAWNSGAFFWGISVIRSFTTFFQELLAQISPRVGFGTQEYLSRTGIILGHGCMNCADQSLTASRREDRNMWANRRWEIICKISSVPKVPAHNR